MNKQPTLQILKDIEAILFSISSPNTSTVKLKMKTDQISNLIADELEKLKGSASYEDTIQALIDQLKNF